jgi:hypothetical protein
VLHSLPEAKNPQSSTNLSTRVQESLIAFESEIRLFENAFQFPDPINSLLIRQMTILKLYRKLESHQNWINTLYQLIWTELITSKNLSSQSSSYSISQSNQEIFPSSSSTAESSATLKTMEIQHWAYSLQQLQHLERLIEKFYFVVYHGNMQTRQALSPSSQSSLSNNERYLSREDITLSHIGYLYSLYYGDLLWYCCEQLPHLVKGLPSSSSSSTSNTASNRHSKETNNILNKNVCPCTSPCNNTNE